MSSALYLGFSLSDHVKHCLVPWVRVFPCRSNHSGRSYLFKDLFLPRFFTIQVLLAIFIFLAQTCLKKISRRSQILRSHDVVFCFRIPFDFLTNCCLLARMATPCPCPWYPAMWPLMSVLKETSYFFDLLSYCIYSKATFK